MGLTGARIKAFGARVDGVLDDLLGGTLVVGADRYAASCAGGVEVPGWSEDGLAEVRRERVLRVAKAILETPPGVGDLVSWEPSHGAAVELRVIEVPERAHETRWRIRCNEV